MKKLINDPQRYVDEALEGMCLAFPGYRKSGRVVSRAAGPAKGKVGVVTGGGFGHLPVFAGYVGTGMLSSCAVGEVFAGPPVEVCGQAIRAGDGEFYIAGGVESMSRSPFVLPKAEEGFSRQAEIADTTIGWRLVNPKMKDEYGVDPLLRSLGLPEDGEHINPNGGAIALGHPLGMSGARLVLTATRELERRKSKRALCTMCVGVGQGISAIIERV